MIWWNNSDLKRQKDLYFFFLKGEDLIFKFDEKIAGSRLLWKFNFALIILALVSFLRVNGIR